MTHFRPFSTPSPQLVFPAATSKLDCTPTRKPPIPVEWDYPLRLDPSPPRLLWAKIDTTLKVKLDNRRISTPSFSSSSSYVSSMTSAQSSWGQASLVPQEDVVSLRHYHARFSQKKSPLRGLVSRMKRAAERPFRLL